MTHRIVVLSPVVDTGAISIEAMLAGCPADGISLEHHFLDFGPVSIETSEDVEACTPALLAKAKTLATQGADAIVVNCMCDPAVELLRTHVACPVIGPAAASMHFAAGTGLSFGFIDVTEESRAETEALVARLGLNQSFASWRAIGVRVLDLYTDRGATIEALVDISRAAVHQDAAGILILGCTGFAELAPLLRQRLHAIGIETPLIEPLALAVGTAQKVLDLRA